MSSSLRLYLMDGWPAQRPNCEWALVEAGNIVQRGNSASENWPKTDQTEVMLDPSLLGCYLVKLPTKANRGSFELTTYAYALEDQLLEDPARYHFAAGKETNAGTCVLAIDRSRLMALLDELGSLGRSPFRLVAAAELLPQRENDWLLWKNPAGELLLQTSPLASCPLDTIAEIRQLAAGANPAPACLRVINGVDRASAAASGLSVVDGGSFDWASADWASATQLLAGTFRPHQHHGRWRQAILWSAIALGLYTASSIGDWATLAWRQAALKQDIQELVRNSLPGQPLMAPLAQLVTAADRQQHQRGKSGVGDFLFLTMQAANVAGERPVQEINYETGRLTIQIDSLDASREKSMRETLAVSGLGLRVARQTNAVRIAISVDAGGGQP